MQTKSSSAAVGSLAGILWTTAASAHPGHSPTDLAAEVSQPLAGPDHLLAFVALTSILLIAFRCALKLRNGRKARE
jgi:hydrogenase/urease accessory protein HupE